MNDENDEAYNIKLDVDNFKKNVSKKYKYFKERIKIDANQLGEDDAYLMFEMSSIMKDMPVKKVAGKNTMGPVLMVLNIKDEKTYLQMMYINAFEITDDDGNKITSKTNPNLDMVQVIKDFILRVFNQTIDSTTVAVAVSISVDYMSGKVKKDEIPDWVKTEEDFDEYTRLNTEVKTGIMASFQPRHSTTSRPKVINIMYTAQSEDGGKNPVFLPNSGMSVALTLSNIAPGGIVDGTKVNTYSGPSFLKDSKKVNNKVFVDIFKECKKLSKAKVVIADDNDGGIITEIKKNIEKRKN